MTNILITGAAGYISSVLIGELLKERYEITAIDNCLYNNEQVLLPYISHPNFTFLKEDVRNTKTLLKLVDKHDIIIPNAALVGMPTCDKNPIDAELINHLQIKQICENKSKDQLILYNNSNSGYGQTDGKSITTEDSPLKPVSLYGKTKCAAESETIKTENYIIFRLATIFGCSLRPRNDLLVNSLVLKAFKEKNLVIFEGGFMRNFLHVKDVVNAVLFALNNWDATKNQIYNLGNDRLNMSKTDLANKIKEHIPIEIIKAEINADKDTRNYIVSSQKFYNKGFSCQYDLDYGIKELIKMYQMIDKPIHANY